VHALTSLPPTFSGATMGALNWLGDSRMADCFRCETELQADKKRQGDPAAVAYFVCPDCQHRYAEVLVAEDRTEMKRLD
jgi:DNA-directed RNA polymerase subunit RPC12/RpoP